MIWNPARRQRHQWMERASVRLIISRRLISLLHIATFLLFIPLTTQADEQTIPAASNAPSSAASSVPAAEKAFQEQVGQVFASRCLQCHNEHEKKGGLSLATEASALQGGESGPAWVSGDADASLLIEYVSGESPAMPQKGEPLTESQVATLRQWISEGATWPSGLTLTEPAITNTDWWSLQPLQAPPVPSQFAEQANWVRTPLDAFVLDELLRNKMRFSPEADRRTLIRRLYFDLIGLPPDYDAVVAFENDADPRAYENLVDRLLNSPQYGERWARHWLDVVHYGDTHGYDKDQPRPNAWPYRDYVIRSFNQDKPYSQFVREQVAGDVLWPDQADAIEATGFISAGPWDLIGHAEVPETKYDGLVARNLDRDDMVSSTINTFLSLTVQCARCHNHKFDPITQEHYYSMQSVFAALDRADRKYDRDPAVAARRKALREQQGQLAADLNRWTDEITKHGGPELAELRKQIEEAERQLNGAERPEFGYHSEISAKQDIEKWVQVDLGSSRVISSVVLRAAKDDFNGIGEGFGFPVRFRVEGSNDATFAANVTILADHTNADFTNPKLEPVELSFSPETVRYVRVTATKLAPRQNDFIFALAELQVRNGDAPLAERLAVTSMDSIEAPPRWARGNLVDGIYPGSSAQTVQTQLAQLRSQLEALLQQRVPESVSQAKQDVERQLEMIQAELDRLPPQHVVYAGTVHHGSGAFQGTGPRGGKPREIRVLYRGELRNPGPVVSPGALPVVQGVDWHFALSPEHAEGERRKALAEWLVRPDNGLLWRSIVNRVWLYHFGRGLVDSPNDFGRMGELPSHPALLEWLATYFRDNGQSFKELHRLIVNSHIYRQTSADVPAFSAEDGDNRLLWRMNRQLLSAEAIRDSVLVVSGRMNPTMYGPAFRDFVLERPEHSPHYEYHKHDPDDVTTHRRSVYRFLVRSQQQPFMQSLGCADPSQSVAKRDSSLTSLQALTLLNNRFMVRMSEHFATRLESLASDRESQIDHAFQIALARRPTAEERSAMMAFAESQGLAYACRVLINLNEFVFVD